MQEAQNYRNLLVLEQFYILKKILKYLLPFILNTHSLVKISKNQEIICTT